MAYFEVITPGFGALPETAFFDNPLIAVGRRKYDTDATVIGVKRGESGYYAVYTQATAEALNNASDVTPAQCEAMLTGSMCGWTVPGANPEFWSRQLSHRPGSVLGLLAKAVQP